MKKQLLRKKLITFSSILGLTLLTNVATADTYFACSSGYTFQYKNNAARCYKPANYMFTSLQACPKRYIPVINKKIGTFYKKNHQGNKDMCVGQFKVGPVTNSTALNTTCRSGYSKQITSGKDRCRKPQPAKKIPPTKQVNR